MTREVSVVGSTGSIGTQAIDVVRRARGEFRITAIGARRSVDLLIAQARALAPDIVAIADADLGSELKAALPGIDVRAGAGALESIAMVGEIVVNGVVGFAGLDVTIAALESGRRLALANKESLIAGAPVVQRARATPGAEIVPVDSEHCAIHQCLGERRHTTAEDLGALGGPNPSDDVSRLIVTASGGPFRGRSAEDLAHVTVEDALAHPTWKMGPKITIDSSTLMNKGLEVIEAHELFGIGFDEIEVVVHPQSIVHSMVEFCDGATIAQLSNPDMRLPIGYSLAYPDRFDVPFGALDWRVLGQLDFAEPDIRTFRCLTLAYDAGRAGGSAPATLNAANEIAVDAFLEGRLSWLGIAEVVEETLDAHSVVALGSVEDVLNADADARRIATRLVARRERAA
jgi:1-deoxy-D-xylulose-5-phosphate reductoisomerase